MRVLLIDDDPVEHRLLEAFLASDRTTNVVLSTALTLEEGVAAIKSDTPDVVLLDNRLPPYDDYRDGVRILREAGYDGSVIVISASTIDESFNDAEKFGVTSIIDKLSLKNRIADGLFG